MTEDNGKKIWKVGGALGAAALISLAGLFTALNAIPYATKEQVRMIRDNP